MKKGGFVKHHHSKDQPPITKFPSGITTGNADNQALGFGLEPKDVYDFSEDPPIETIVYEGGTQGGKKKRIWHSELLD